ncbi:hypothetical protein N824_29295 [Pedobacter sp. V48]|nr:hypothetical protein N824_29295 [Pedobacter sp. V48]
MITTIVPRHDIQIINTGFQRGSLIQNGNYWRWLPMSVGYPRFDLLFNLLGKL